MQELLALPRPERGIPALAPPGLRRRGKTVVLGAARETGGSRPRSFLEGLS